MQGYFNLGITLNEKYLEAGRFLKALKWQKGGLLAVFENNRGHAYILFEPFIGEVRKYQIGIGRGFWYGVLSELRFVAGYKEN